MYAGTSIPIAANYNEKTADSGVEHGCEAQTHLPVFSVYMHHHGFHYRHAFQT
jgi:hypothetical protein